MVIGSGIYRTFQDCSPQYCVLGIAELGFNTAIVYSLYRPMSEHDENKICEIVSLFQKSRLDYRYNCFGFRNGNYAFFKISYSWLIQAKLTYM